MYPLQTTTIAPGVSFHSLQEPQFKMNQISVHFFCEMNRETASNNALVFSILKRGCASYPDMISLNQRLEELYGAQLQEGIRKMGDDQVVSLTLTILDDSYALKKEPLLQDGVKLLLEVLFQPVLENGRFRQADFEIEKQNLIDLIESEINDKRMYAMDRMNEILFADYPAGVPLFGTVQTAREVTEEAAIQAYRNLLHHANVQIFCTGPGDMRPIESLFKNAFQALSREKVSSLQMAPHDLGKGIKELTERFQVQQSKLVMGFTSPGNDPEKLHAHRLLTAIFGGTPTSKLFIHVRERLSLCYYCAARYDKIKNVIMVDSGVKEENIQKAREEIVSQLSDIAQGKVTEQEFTFALLSLTHALYSLYDSPTGLENWYLTQICMNTKQTPEEDIEALTHTTKEQVQKAASEMHLSAVYILTGQEEAKNE